MMLVHLPAIEAVAVPALPSFPSLPSFNLGIAHTLIKPSTWLVLLATLVILSSIRAAFLYVRPPSWTANRKSVSFVTIVKKEKPTPVESASETESQGRKGKSKTTTGSPTEQRRTSSWLWGLVKWDSLPPAPQRGGWQSPPQMQQVQLGRPRRPAFDHPLPALYETQVPVSMAKMIMSRHTFRRPASRPPPVRNASAPQYQKRAPSMV